ncbi:hypothetical protein ABZ569_22330 [Streptomyces albus]|uniref:hypothetical protein n=1 Tax=Streptomyces albus TaxID=1888 RepID=UPI0033D38757
MNQQGETHNNLSGYVEGPAMMMRDLHGNVEFHAPVERRSPEEEELRRRKLEQERRELDRREAQEQERYRQAKRYVLECRIRKWGCTVVMPVALVIAVLGAIDVLAVNFAVAGFMGFLFSLIGWMYNARIVRDWDAGRMIKFPMRR